MGSGGSKKKEQTPPPAKTTTPNNTQKVVYKPFTQFPDPVLLAKAQLDYHKGGVAVEQKDGVPVPHPPPDTKERLLAKHEFTTIDSYASSADALDHAEGDYKQLASYLTRPAKNEVEKVRAFFMFIACQGPRQVFKHTGNTLPPQGSPLLGLVTILSKNLSGLYNEMLVNLCRESGIPVIRERTDVKGSTYRVGHPIGRHGNTVCLVYVDKCWRMIDQHWGSESVSADPDDEWTLVDDQGATQTKGSIQKQYFHEVKEFYFLTDPVAMAYSHLCETPQRQLLARPLTKKDFDEIAYLEAGFFEFGMNKLSHPQCVVRCENGSVIFKFGLDKSRKFRFYHNVYKSAKDPKTDRFNGREPKDFSRKYISPDGSEVTISIDFPWIGKYKLEMQGIEVGSPYRKGICEYLIHVSVPKHGAEPMPSLPAGQDELGVPAVIRAMGVSGTDDGGVITTKNGQARVLFNLPKDGALKFRPLLMLPAGSTVKADNKSIVRYYIADGKLVIITRVTSQAQRLLRVNVLKNGREERINYLVLPDQACPDWVANFPPSLVDGGQVGDLAISDGDRLIPVSHQEPIFESPANGHTCIEMKQESDQDLQINASLAFYPSTSGSPVEASDFLFHEHEGKKHYFSLRFTRAGIYSLNIMSQTANHYLYQYIIFVPTPDTNAIPFPNKLEGWKDGMKVNEPREGELTENTNVHFKIQIPGATKVKVEGHNQSTDLNPGKNGEWEGDININDDTPEIKINAEMENEFTNVLTYQVLDEGQGQQRDEERKQFAHEAKQEVDNRDKKESQAKQDAENAQKKKEEEIKKAEKDFEANRGKYEERETELEKEQEEKEQPVVNEPDYSNLNLSSEMEDEELKKKMERKKKETEEGWKQLYGESSKKIAMERLKEATTRRDLDGMKSGLALCEAKGVQGDIMDKARLYISIEYRKQSLRKAMNEEDIEQLDNEIEDILNDRTMRKHLQRDVSEAKAVLERLKRARSIGYRVLDMDAKTMSEMRRYNNPPTYVQNVLKAALLLLGEDEGTTEEWKSVQKLLNPSGTNGLNRRVMNFDITSLNHELAARSQEILQSIDYNKLQKQSAGGAIFYIWSMGIVQDANVPSEVKPADITRQKDILGRATPPPKRKHYQKYYDRKRGSKSPQRKTPRGEDGDQTEKTPNDLET